MKKITAVFYRTARGKEPVREWLKKLGPSDSKVIGTDIRTVEYGWPVGMPVSRPLGNGLHEVRSELNGNRTARVIFCIKDGFMFLLHGFVKKRRKRHHRRLDLRLHANGNWRWNDMPKSGHAGSTFEDFLVEEGMDADVTAVAVKRVLAWQMAQAMEREKITKTELASRMKTSRAALDRLLDPENTSVSLHTMEKAAVALGHRLEVHLR